MTSHILWKTKNVPNLQTRYNTCISTHFNQYNQYINMILEIISMAGHLMTFNVETMINHSIWGSYFQANQYNNHPSEQYVRHLAHA